jgi:hypothetical protein
MVLAFWRNWLNRKSKTAKASLHPPTRRPAYRPQIEALEDRRLLSILQFGAASYSVGEGDGNAQLTVTRTGGTGPVSVRYLTVSGTARAGTDYTDQSGTLSFAAGEMSKPLLIAIQEDSLFESNETFGVILRDPTDGATLGEPAGALVTIVDNDAPPNPAILHFGAAAYAVNETAGTAAIAVLRGGNMAGTVSVDYAFGAGNARAGVDYSASLTGRLAILNNLDNPLHGPETGKDLTGPGPPGLITRGVG